MSFSKAQELLRLAFMASAARGVTLLEIVESFGCSHRTAQRMTDALCAAFPTTEQAFDDDRRARWVLPARAVTALATPSAEELAGLSAAIQVLDREGMATEAATLRLLAAKVRAMIPKVASLRLATDEEALLEALGYAVRPGPRSAVNAEVDRAISEALKGPSLLRLAYRARGQSKSVERVVAPHGLLLGVRRYLVARPRSGGKMHHYRVEDIEGIEVLADSFVFDDGFEISAHARKAFGSYIDDKEFGEVVWRFTPKAASHARRFLFHPSQEAEVEKDGSLLVRFWASGQLEMCWHLYAWGDQVEVLQPAALRELVRGHRRSDFPALP